MMLGLAASGIASLAGGAMQSSAAKGGANAQANAANNAAMLQYVESQQANQLIQSIYGQNQARLAPFVGAGQQALGTLQGLTGAGAGGNPLTAPLTKPFAPTMEQLAQTPGYQFALQQGLLATQAGSSAQGQGTAVSGAGGGSIGPSGPLGKALANYAEGLAGTTYQNQFQNNLASNMQSYNMLMGQVGLGENAAAQTGTMGTTAGGQSANALLSGASGFGQYSTAGAAATASGMVGSAGALSNALTGAGNSALLYGMFGGSDNLNQLGGSSNFLGLGSNGWQMAGG